LEWSGQAMTMILGQIEDPTDKVEAINQMLKLTFDLATLP